MQCAAHPDIEAKEACSACQKSFCQDCLGCEVDGRVACEKCGREVEERGSALGSSVLAFVAAGYLAALAVGVLLFHGRAFIGGLAAVIAIAVGRGLSVFVKLPVVTRRG